MSGDVEVRESDVAQEVAELARAILAEHSGPDDGSINRSAWNALCASGLTELLTPIDRGGAGAGWPEVGALLFEIGGAAACVPVAEHDVLAGWLLDRAGLPRRGSGVRTASLFADGVSGDGAWAREADTVVVLRANADGWTVSEIDPRAADISPGRNFAGEYRDLVHLGSDHEGRPVSAELVDEFRLRLAVSRAAMIAGASERIVEHVVAHATSREQFGRPLAKFQAVQQLVSQTAAEASLVSAAVDGAVSALGRFEVTDPRGRLAVLAAASCAAHGSAVIARNAHQVLGAMGYTREHPLHRFTNRILAWRSEAASVRDIDMALLRQATTHEPLQLWGLLVDSDSKRSQGVA
jgi:acyl-CoA dehydrogenase